MDRTKKERRERTKKRMRVIPVLLLVLVMLAGMTACGAKRYHVDYLGRKSAYTGAKDTYPAGAHVRLYYENWATDTDYSFYLDDESLKYEWDERHGFVIEFTMPAHDVTLRCESHNSMEYDPGAFCSNPMEALLTIEFSRLDVDYEEVPSETGYTMQVFCPEDGDAKVLVETMEGARDVYLVGEEIIDDVFRLAEEAGMQEWDRRYDTEYVTLDAYTFMSMLWLTPDEVYYADYSHLPEDGEDVFETIEARLWRDLDEAHLIEHAE